MNFEAIPLYLAGGGGGGAGSVSISAGAGITVSPNPITSIGSIAVDPTVLADVTDNKRKLTTVEWDDIDTVTVDDNLDVTGDVTLSNGNIYNVGSQGDDLVSIATTGQGTTSQVSQVAPRGLSENWTVTTLSSLRSEALYAENLDLLLTFSTGTGIYWSDDGGVTHTLCTGAFGGRVFVAYDGITFVGVEVNTGGAWTSTDGKNFTALPAPGFGTTKMTYYNGYFVASTDVPGQRVAISGDSGVSWILQTLTNDPYNFAQNANVLTSCSGTGFAWTFNGISWFEAAAGPNCRAICWNPDQEVFVSMARDGSGDVYESRSGSVWILYAGAQAVTVNFMIYVSQFKRYYIVKANDATGRFGVESSRNPISDPFITRQIPNATIQTIFYNFGYLALYDRFFICENAGRFNYSTNSQSLVALSDSTTANLTVQTINNLTPFGGKYLQLTAASPISATTTETSLFLGSTSVGNLSAAANTLELACFTLVCSGTFGSKKDDTITFRLNPGAVTLVLTTDALIDTTGEFFEIEAQYYVTALGAAGAAVMTVNFHLQYSEDGKPNRSLMQTVSDNTTFSTLVPNTLSITAEFSSNNVANTIQLLASHISRTY